MDTIITKILGGDRHVLEKIYVEWREPFIIWSVRTFEGTRDQAIEFYQMVILIFYDNILNGKLTELNGSVKSYLFAIGKNKWREYYRERQRRQLSDLDLIQMVTSEEDRTSPSQSILLGRALEILGSPGRQLLEAYYYQCLKLDDIVIRFGYKNKDVAKTAKYKSLQRLKRILVSLSHPEFIRKA